ncbi:CD63 antigen [Cyphomyrmex costatus]|uniref:CD63 antigen n=2 Tax=Cyphomyrmex costatus TaxID=456900 RepID=A0A195C5J9_9HYME|nr:CD63 antigen [Cyphomyrmex costatus]
MDPLRNAPHLWSRNLSSFVTSIAHGSTTGVRVPHQHLATVHIHTHARMQLNGSSRACCFAAMAMTKLSLAPKTIKYLMFIFNLFFVITGIVLLSIGAVIHGVYHQYQHFLDNSFFSVPSLLVAVGSIIFIIAFFGCCGAVRESYCMVTTFCVLLAAIFLLEIIGGIMGYVMRTQVAMIAQQKMLDTMPQYNNSHEIQAVWDNLQKDFHCCGTINATDWLTIATNLSGIPMSCCDNMIGAVGTSNCTLSSESLHKVGCINAFATFAERHAAKIAGVGISLGVIQLIGILLSSYLAKSIKNCYQTM